MFVHVCGNALVCGGQRLKSGIFFCSSSLFFFLGGGGLACVCMCTWAHVMAYVHTHVDAQSRHQETSVITVSTVFFEAGSFN